MSLANKRKRVRVHIFLEGSFSAVTISASRPSRVIQRLALQGQPRFFWVHPDLSCSFSHLDQTTTLTIYIFRLCRIGNMMSPLQITNWGCSWHQTGSNKHGENAEITAGYVDLLRPFFQLGSCPHSLVSSLLCLDNVFIEMSSYFYCQKPHLFPLPFSFIKTGYWKFPKGASEITSRKIFHTVLRCEMVAITIFFTSVF